MCIESQSFLENVLKSQWNTVVPRSFAPSNFFIFAVHYVFLIESKKSQVIYYIKQTPDLSISS